MEEFGEEGGYVEYVGLAAELGLKVRGGGVRPNLNERDKSQICKILFLGIQWKIQCILAERSGWVGQRYLHEGSVVDSPSSRNVQCDNVQRLISTRARRVITFPPQPQKYLLHPRQVGRPRTSPSNSLRLRVLQLDEVADPGPRCSSGQRVRK